MRKGGCSLLSISQLCSYYILRCGIGAVNPWISLFSIRAGVFHQALQLFYFEFFLLWCSSSSMNSPSLMSSGLLVIFGIGSSVTFWEIPSRSLKCCFHWCIRSSWLAAFSLVRAVLFLQLSSFTVCYVILYCLSSTKSLIQYMWSWMYSVCSFRFILFGSLFWLF